MIKNQLHQKIISHKKTLKEWFLEKSKDLFFPFYSSFDLRDSGLKIVPIDSNLFPAGFNNICEVDRESIPESMNHYLKKHYPKVQNISLLTEEHTHNFYYWDNVSCIKEMLEKAHSYQINVCVPGKRILQDLEITSASGKTLHIQPLKDKSDLILSNNDFSTPFHLPQNIPVNPPYGMGWHARRKNSFFQEYNKIAEEFSKLIEIDPWHLTIQTELFEPFSVKNPESIHELKKSLIRFLKKLHPSYEKRSETPFVFIKNNRGTYGLGVTSIQTPDEVENWNYKTKKKMKAAKEGQEFNQLILQEGIPTILSQSNGSAEPVIYTIGSELIGGFLRVHQKKGVRENLNSPGSVFKQLCMSDLKIQIEGKNEENVYGWVARISLLALALEIKKSQNSLKR